MSTRTYLIGQGYDNLRKHGGKTFSTMLIICATMFVLGIFIIAFVNIQSNVKTVSENQGLQAFISDDVLDSQIDSIAKKINQVSNVKNIKYIDKAGALKDAKKTLKEYAYLLDNLEQINPFPRSFVVTFETLKSTKDVKEAIESVDGIYKVSYNEAIIDAVVSISRIGNYVIVGLGIVMVLLSVFIISNTIKLAVYSNKREIYIMKYIGATSKFIKYPFIVEGILMGIGAAIVSWIVVSLGYTIAYTGLPKIGSELGVFGFVGYSKFWYLELGAFLLLGVVLGGAGSALATRKYLKEFNPIKVTGNKKEDKVKIENKAEESREIKTPGSRTGRVGASIENSKSGFQEEKTFKNASEVAEKENSRISERELAKRMKFQEKEEIKLKKKNLKKAEQEKRESKKEVKKEFERKRKARRLSVFFLIVMIIYSLLPTIQAASTRDKIDEIDKQASAAAKEYERVQSDIKVYEKDIEKLNGEVEKYATSVDQLSAKVTEVNKEVEALENELQNVSSNYEATEQLLNTRLRALYENGFVNVWEIMFTSQNAVDFLAKYNVLITLIQYDQKLLTAMQSQKEYINNLRESADLRKLQVEQVQYDVNKSKEALEAAKSNKTARVSQLEGSETKLKSILSNLRAERAKQERILAAEIAAAQNPNINFAGEFTWPAPGVYTITALFRDKEYYNWSGGSVHKGVDMARSGGCNIVAAQSGTVITASGVGAYNGGYGNYVIIDHGTNNKDGKRYVTLYGHLASVAVTKGQTVVKGQKIGYMGSTGWSTGTHLHFEIRQNNVQINAMNYFPEIYGVAKYYSYNKWIAFPYSNQSKYMI